jgi:K+-sensing histidine kinase KdpD
MADRLEDATLSMPRGARKPIRAVPTRSVPARGDAESLAALEDRTLVLLPASPFAETLVRRVAPLTHRIRGPFWCLHVTVPGENRDEDAEIALRSACMLARSLGGEVIESVGESLEKIALQTAADIRATEILLGMPRRQKTWPFRGATLASKLAKHCGDAHVLVDAEPLDD